MNIKSFIDLLRLVICPLICPKSSEAPLTVEEIIAQNSAGMSDEQKAQYWHELSLNIFALLGKVEVPRYEIGASDWFAIAKAQYPSLTDVKLADARFYTTSLNGLQLILSRDWTNLVKYAPEYSDCDDFATRLYSHLQTYYLLSGIIPIWGLTGSGYHAFNLAVVRENNLYIARLIEPQTDQIFVEEGPLGRYIPQRTATELAIYKRPIS